MKTNNKLRILLRRSLVIYSANIFLFFVLIGRLYYLQIYEKEKYTLLADSNRISERLLVPPRGSINDRNGVELAMNNQNFQAMITAEHVQNLDDLLNKITPIINLTDLEKERIKRYLTS